MTPGTTELLPVAPSRPSVETHGRRLGVWPSPVPPAEHEAVSSGGDGSFPQAFSLSPPPVPHSPAQGQRGVPCLEWVAQLSGWAGMEVGGHRPEGDRRCADPICRGVCPVQLSGPWPWARSSPRGRSLSRAGPGNRHLEKSPSQLGSRRLLIVVVVSWIFFSGLVCCRWNPAKPRSLCFALGRC